MAKRPREPAKVGKGKIIELSGTAYVRVDKEWLEDHGIARGDEVILIANSDYIVRPKNKDTVKETHDFIEKLSKRSES